MCLLYCKVCIESTSDQIDFTSLVCLFKEDFGKFAPS